MLVSEMTQITAHEWNVVHGYKTFVDALHNRPHLSRIAWNKASSAAIAVTSDHN